jgi:hypothetical protein
MNCASAAACSTVVVAVSNPPSSRAPIVLRLAQPHARKETEVGEESTCGQGLAAHSALPVKLGELTAAVADVLEFHTTALDRADENARREHDVYLELVAKHRETAARLRSTGEAMARARDLPMAKHDATVMASPQAADVFEKLVAVEENLLALLGERLAQDREMLVQMRRA